jgi:beta-mannosidase
VPGCVHSDLGRAGVIPPLDWRDNEALQQWIDGETWTYRRTFVLADIAFANIELVCDGLDTLATISLNGKVVLETDNMFRTWRAAAGPHLQEGENSIEVTFHSTLPKIAAGQAKRPLREWNTYFDRYLGRGHVRKMACSYGWDWGPVAATAGIWKNIRLEFTRDARWLDLHIRQQHAPGLAALEIVWQVSGPGGIRFELWRDGRLIAETTAPSTAANAKLEVKNPELWWPNTLGAQPLYELRAILISASGMQDVWTRRIGLRALRLVRERDAVGESFFFEINGRAVFAKGANWIPVRILLPEITREDYRKLLQDAADANMNMLRVWGGGIYENDDFYDLCDELGILVWQDFAFACGMYPSWDDDFLASVEAEARDNVRRLRHHPSLALWCGNNELEMGFAGKPDYSWEVYGRLFDKLLARICAELDPDTAYWPSSPHTPIGDRDDFNSDLSGDTHHWSVFFGRQPFEAQRTWRTRFMSEFGFQSYPELRTIESFTAPEDRFFMSRILDYHQRSEVGNQTIFSYLLDWFQPPLEFAELLTLSQITHALCVRYATEHLRRIQPLCGGVLYWQINDIWPCASWSSIDSFGRWKALQYEARRFFAPVLVSIEEDLLTSRARIHLSNQLPTERVLDVRWQVTDTDGKVLLDETASVKAPSQTGHYVADIDATPLLKNYHAHDLMIWAWASERGTVLSRNWASLARPKYLSIAEPQIEIDLETARDGTLLHLSCAKPAPYVVLALQEEDARFDDNFFHLHPGEKRTIKMTAGPKALAREQIKIRSLADWMPARKTNEMIPPRPSGYELQRKR